MKKTEQIHIRVTPAEKAAMQREAQIHEVSLSHWHIKGGFSFYGAKKPVSLVVISPAGKRAFRITGEEVALDQLMQEVPDIAGVLGAV